MFYDMNNCCLVLPKYYFKTRMDTTVRVDNEA